MFFLDQLDADALSISQEEFDEGLLLANAQEQARLEMKRTTSTAGKYARRPVSNRGTGRVTSCYPSCGMSSGVPGASVDQRASVCSTRTRAAWPGLLEVV